MPQRERVSARETMRSVFVDWPTCFIGTSRTEEASASKLDAQHPPARFILAAIVDHYRDSQQVERFASGVFTLYHRHGREAVDVVPYAFSQPPPVQQTRNHFPSSFTALVSPILPRASSSLAPSSPRTFSPSARLASIDCISSHSIAFYFGKFPKPSVIDSSASTGLSQAQERLPLTLKQGASIISLITFEGFPPCSAATT